MQELYHEMHALDRFEQDCRRKAQEEDSSNAAQRGTYVLQIVHLQSNGSILRMLMCCIFKKSDAIIIVNEIIYVCVSFLKITFPIEDKFVECIRDWL